MGNFSMLPAAEVPATPQLLVNKFNQSYIVAGTGTNYGIDLNYFSAQFNGSTLIRESVYAPPVRSDGEPLSENFPFPQGTQVLRVAKTLKTNNKTCPINDETQEYFQTKYNIMNNSYFSDPAAKLLRNITYIIGRAELTNLTEREPMSNYYGCRVGPCPIGRYVPLEILMY